MNKEDMKLYVGVKMVKAMPMTKGDFDYLLNKNPDNEDQTPGYLVEYRNGGPANHPDFDGYISWSPAAPFEGSHLVIDLDNHSRIGAYSQDYIDDLAELAIMEDKLVKIQKRYDAMGDGVNAGRSGSESTHLASLRQYIEQLRKVIHDKYIY